MPPADHAPNSAPRHIAAILPEVLARYGLSLPEPAREAPPAIARYAPAPAMVAANLLAAGYAQR